MATKTGSPDYPTSMMTMLSGGRLLGTDGSMWLYRSVPMNPVVDAASTQEMLAAGEPILEAFEELADLARVGVARRATARSSYRQVHLLLLNVDAPFMAPEDHPIGAYLESGLSNETTVRRVLLFGVRILDKVTSGGLKAAVDSVAETLWRGSVPIEDFDADYRTISNALGRAGLRGASDSDLTLASSWWTWGDRADVVMAPHASHVHIFNDANDVQRAAEIGTDCNEEGWSKLDQHSLSFVSIQDFDMDIVGADTYAALWASRLVRNGAKAISIRGGVEPAKVTRAELRRRKKQYLDDLNEAAENGKMERQEQVEAMHRLDEAEQAFSMEGAPPVLTGASVVAAIDGRISDVHELSNALSLKVRSMDFRQLTAMAEVWPCSNLRSNPHLHDIPVQTIAYSGLPSISRVGDVDGAMLGLTETDRQPAFISPTAAARGDALPICSVVGATGSGKTQVLLWLADQYARMGHPVVIVDPKLGSDHSASVLASGGQVASLDKLAQSDGVFDPLRFAVNPEAGVEMACSMLSSVNPWGNMLADYETPLIRAIRYGVDSGATCVGEALRAAERGGKAPSAMVQSVFDLAESSPMFRACMGINPGTDALRVADGITLIKVGSAHLDITDLGSDPARFNVQQRTTAALVRMMLFGSATALTGREGVVMLDEAWVFTGAGRSEVERLGRLARSQGVLPMLFTQKVSDSVNAGLSGYISRGLILPLEKEEARAACELFELDPTPERLGRITARGTIGGEGDGEGGSPNWRSMRHLRDPVTKETIRGSVAIYADLHGRAVPVEVVIPKEFLERASTNPDDIRKREQREREADATETESFALGAGEPVLPAPVKVLPAGVPIPPTTTAEVPAQVGARSDFDLE